MSINIANIMTTITNAPIDTMPSWMSISEGETIGTDHPVEKCSLKKKLGVAGSAFKKFFGEQAKVYRI
jgi:hypothetical protein